MQWLGTKQFKVTRQTIYNHRAHITDPKVTFVEEARKKPVIKVSNDDFLQAVIDAAANRVVEDPDSVTIEQGLKAVAVRENRREKQVNILLAVAELVTSRQPIEMIEGVYREVLGDSPVEELTTSERSQPEAAGVRA